MSDMTVTLVCAIVGSQALLEIVKAIISALRRPTALQMAVRWLLEDRLERIITDEIRKGETTKRMRKYIRRGYQYYKGLKGNGDMDQLMEDYRRVPVRY